jgi:hypothetical protein
MKKSKVRMKHLKKNVVCLLILFQILEAKHGKETPWMKRVHLSKRSYHTKNQIKKTNERHNSNSDDLGKIKKSIFKFESSDEDASIFNTICGNDLKKEVVKNVKLSMKKNTVDIFITGSFRNAKTGKSSWIILCKDYGSAWTLKSQFIKGYIGTLLTKIKSQLSTLITPVLFMTSTSANMNLVQKVYGGIKNRVKPPRGCPSCIPVTQLTKEMANRVLSRQLSSCS